MYGIANSQYDRISYLIISILFKCLNGIIMNIDVASKVQNKLGSHPCKGLHKSRLSYMVWFPHDQEFSPEIDACFSGFDYSARDKLRVGQQFIAEFKNSFILFKVSQLKCMHDPGDQYFGKATMISRLMKDSGVLITYKRGNKKSSLFQRISNFLRGK